MMDGRALKATKFPKWAIHFAARRAYDLGESLQSVRSAPRSVLWRSCKGAGFGSFAGDPGWLDGFGWRVGDHLPVGQRRGAGGVLQETVVDLDPPGQHLPVRPHHRGAVAVQHRPRRLVGAQPQQAGILSVATQPGSAVMYQPAANHTVSGVRVFSKIVPAVRDARLRQPPHRHTRPDATAPAVHPYAGHTTPSGQRNQSR